MGCNVGSLAEVFRAGRWQPARLQPRDNGWGHLSPEPWTNRDYATFHRLVGLRTDPARGGWHAEPPLFRLRGLPQDASPEALIAADPDTGVHSQSWLLLSELLHHQASLAGSELDQRTIPMLREIPAATPEEIRLVFWFEG